MIFIFSLFPISSIFFCILWILVIFYRRFISMNKSIWASNFYLLYTATLARLICYWSLCTLRCFSRSLPAKVPPAPLRTPPMQCNKPTAFCLPLSSRLRNDDPGPPSWRAVCLTVPGGLWTVSGFIWNSFNYLMPIPTLLNVLLRSIFDFYARFYLSSGLSSLIFSSSIISFRLRACASASILSNVKGAFCCYKFLTKGASLIYWTVGYKLL